MTWIATKEQTQYATANRTKDEAIATRYFLVFYSVLTPPASGDGHRHPNLCRDIAGRHWRDYPRRVKAITTKSWDDADAIIGTIWQVQVDYSDKVDINANPLSLPAEYTWDFGAATQTYFMDNLSTPKPTINSAGQGFDSLLERETGTVLVTRKRNVSGFSPATVITYCCDAEKGKAVNSDGFTIDGQSIGVGQAIIEGVTVGPYKLTNGVQYREETTQVKLRNSWDDKIADVGYNELVSGKLVPIMMSNSNANSPPKATDKPWPLNGSGAKKTNATDTPSTLTFKPYQPLPFSVFGFS